MKRVNNLSQWTRAKKLSQTALFSSLGGQFAVFLKHGLYEEGRARLKRTDFPLFK
ncbi:hypothetical protein BSM4216_2707 [Bacillus smithii]|nr:hypothetical protein BSM4216_2707 [Bacillus smithii]